jgi:hypothetical protein
MGWPFTTLFKKRYYKHYKQENLKKIGNYKPTNWVLIEPNSNYHYGFIDAGLLNFPTYNYDLWYSPTLQTAKFQLESQNAIQILLQEVEEGSKNPWARPFGYEISGPLIFNSEFRFGISDIEMLEKNEIHKKCDQTNKDGPLSEKL